MRPPEEDTRKSHNKPCLIVATDNGHPPENGAAKAHGHVRLLEDDQEGLQPTPDQSVLIARLGTLRQEHSDLDAAIAALAAAPHFDGLMAARLKKKKLRLKDMIEELKDQLTPDIIA